MEFVILNTVSQHSHSTDQSLIVWVKHSAEHLIYGKSHVNLFLSTLFYFRMVRFFLFFFFSCSLFCFLFFFFFAGVTVNPNITKQEGTAFFIASDDHVQILSMPSNASVESVSFVSTPGKIYSHRNYHFFCFVFFFTKNIQGWSRHLY